VMGTQINVPERHALTLGTPVEPERCHWVENAGEVDGPRQNQRNG
jgi:hypothetical protein